MKDSGFVSRGYILILAASFFWGTSGTAQTFAPEAATPFVIGAVRIGLGGLVLFMTAAVRGNLPELDNWPFKSTCLAALSIAAYQLFFFSAVELTGVAVATVVTMGSSPVLAGLLAWLVKGQKPVSSWYPATLLAILGCILLFLPEGETVVEPLGLLLSLGGGGVYALYALISKDLLKERSAETVMAMVGLIGGLILLPIIVINRPEWLLETRGLQVAAYLGVFSMALPYLLFNIGLILVPLASAMTLTLAEPLTAALLGILLVGERLTFLNYLGLIFIMLGISFLSFTGQKASRN